MKEMKKILSFFLCFVMLLGFIPATAFAVRAEETGNTETESVIIAMSDYQNSSLSSDAKKTVPQTIVNAMVAAGVQPELALIGGDYTDGGVGADGDDQSQANLKTELNNLTGILTSGWSGLPYYAIQGNHDYSGFLTDGTLKATGAYEQDNYIVYLINEDSFPWWQGNYGSGSSTSEDKATVTATTNALSTYLDSLISSGDTRPVIIMSHVPMHWSERSTAANWYYDNIYANILFDAINEKAEELDILFLFGHNHSSTASGGDYDYEIGGALSYVAVGESMKVPNGTDGTSNYTTEKLNFTYMNAGYVGKYAGSTSNCSISALTIDSDSIDISRYTYSGAVYTETIALKNTEPAVAPDYITVTGTDAYAIGDELAIRVQASYVDSETKQTTTVDVTDGYTITGDYDMNAVKDNGSYYEITVTYQGKSDSFQFTVSQPSVFGDTKGNTGVSVSGVFSISGITVENNTDANKAVAEALGVENYVSYDITPTGITMDDGTYYDLRDGNYATVSIPVDSSWENVKCYYIPEGSDPVEVKGTLKDGVFTFRTNHFSTWLIYEVTDVTGSWIDLGSTTTTGGYQQVTSVNDLESGEKYLVVVWRYFAGTNSNSTKGYVFHSANNGNYRVNTSDNYATVTAASGTTISDNQLWYITKTGSNTITMQNVGTSKYLGTSIPADSNSARTLYITSGTYTYQNFAIGTSTSNSIRYSSSSSSFSFNSSYSHSSATSSANACNITIYKSVAGGTVDNGHARLVGPTTLSCTTLDGATEASILDLLTIQTSTDDGATVAETIDVTSDMVTWDKTFDGTTAGTYTATVTYKGKTLGTVKVTVSAKSIDSIELVDKLGTVVRGSSTSAKVGAKIKVYYNDNTSVAMEVTLAMVSGNFDISTEGTYEGLTVTYGGKSVTGLTLQVIKRQGNDFPEYPDPGSVDLNKVIGDSTQFQNTGVVEVELSTSGIPMNQGVDVVVVLDTSSSMQETVEGFSSNRLTILRPAVNSLIEQLQTKREDGSDPDLDIAIVAFNGFTGNGNSSTMYGSENYIEVQAYATPNAGGWLTDENGDGWVDIMDLPTNWADADQGNIDTGSGTNYDEGLQMAYDLLSAKQGMWEDGEVRQQYVVFMSDGAPFQYNGVYSNYTSKEWNNWLLGNYATENDIPDTVTNKSYYAGYAAGNGQDHRIAEAIKGDPNTNYDIVTTTADTNGSTEFKSVPGLGATMYTIGYLLADNGQVSNETQDIVLKNMASTEDLYFDVDTADELDNAFNQIASAVLMAATDAYFVDQMGDDFNLQMASTVTKFAGTNDETTVTLNPAPQITVSTYEVYGKTDIGKTINGVTVTQEMVGQRYGSATVLETVTFNAAGTEAYSTVNGVTSGNIIKDGVICAVNFFYNTTSEIKTVTLADGSTYDLPAETFRWNIGTINEKEFVLSYYVYLEGAAEGTRPAGTYDTNNYATLYYTNWLENDVSQSVQSPAVAWQSAAVYYGFYLVNSQGQPVVNQTTGETGSFADAVKVTSKIFYDEVLLNDVGSVGTTIQVVSTKVPAGYTIYDEGATYTITIDSNKTISGWKIVNTESPDTTYVAEYRGNETTNVTDSDDLSQSGMDYTATTVWFAVVWEPQCIDDTVVIDYGLPVDISVMVNDMFGNYGTLVGVGTLANKPAGEYATTDSANFTDTLTSTYGTAKVNGAKVRYTPANMQMNSYDRFCYEVKYTVNGSETNLQYYYGTVTVIPATTIYYEDSFVTLDSYTKGTDGNFTKDTSTKWTQMGTTTDATQAEDRPGEYSLPTIDANNVYGYDQAYSSMSTYSMDSAAKITVDANTRGEAIFTFYGTGFDVVGLTSADTGTLTVQVYAGASASGTAVKTTLVDTYYGMAENGSISVNNPDAIYQVPVIKISGLTYGQYTVKITAGYNAIFDQVDGSTSYDLYLDAVRIYDPTGVASGSTSNDTVSDAYVADGEGWPQYTELRNNIISAEGVTSTTDDDGNVTVTFPTEDTLVQGAIFIDCNDAVNSVKDYVNHGPNNELYLKSGQAVAFNINFNNLDSIVADVQIGLKVANGGSASYQIHNADEDGNKTNVITGTLNTTTDMYYSILTQAKGGTIVITNNTTSPGILSITNIKITYKQNPNGTSASSIEIDEKSATNAVNSLADVEMVQPNFTPDKMDISFNRTTAEVGNNVVVTVTTSNDVENLLVNGYIAANKVTSQVTGETTWSFTVPVEENSNLDVTIVGYDVYGQFSVPYTESVTVITATGTAEDLLGQLFG